MKSAATRHKIAAAILAGGKSSRMGEPKAGVTLASGKTLFSTVYSTICELDFPCVIVGHAEGIRVEEYRDLIVLPDTVHERGPVGALFALFQSDLARHYLVVACDQPLLHKELLTKLLDICDDRPNVFAEPPGTNMSPLPGLYPATLLRSVESLLEQPRASLRELLSSANVRTVLLTGEDWKLLRSANTRQDLNYINSHLSQS